MQRLHREAAILAAPYGRPRPGLYADILLIGEIGEGLAQFRGGRGEGTLGERAGELDHDLPAEQRGPRRRGPAEPIERWRGRRRRRRRARSKVAFKQSLSCTNMRDRDPGLTSKWEEAADLSIGYT